MADIVNGEGELSPLDLINLREHSIQQQIIAWQKLMFSDAGSAAMQKGKLEAEQIVAPLFDRLRRLYLEDLPIAKLRQFSDLIIHIDGGSAAGNVPQLRAVNWLGRTARTQFTKLAAVALPSQQGNNNEMAKSANWGITGLVPGSIFMGFALQRPCPLPGFEVGDKQVFDSIVDAARTISIVPQFVRNDRVNKEITDAITDPALRDAAMMAAMQLSPSKTFLFDTVKIYAPGGASGTLHFRERTTLRHALLKPMMRRKQEGEFIGELNEVDLDSSRFQLRNISGIGTLRCVMDFTRAHARTWLGHKVKVVGTYDTDVSGRPRLMRVKSISVLEQQVEMEEFKVIR